MQSRENPNGSITILIYRKHPMIHCKTCGEKYSARMTKQREQEHNFSFVCPVCRLSNRLEYTDYPYVCETCGKSGVALYRDYGAFFSVPLKCRACVENLLNGEYEWKNDILGWWGPAVEIVPGKGEYWAGIPDKPYDYWKSLPKE